MSLTPGAHCCNAAVPYCRMHYLGNAVLRSIYSVIYFCIKEPPVTIGRVVTLIHCLQLLCMEGMIFVYIEGLINRTYCNCHRN